MSLITALDMMEVDCDGEPDLGWTGHGRGCQPGEPADDREGDDEREPDDFTETIM